MFTDCMVVHFFSAPLCSCCTDVSVVGDGLWTHSVVSVYRAVKPCPLLELEVSVDCCRSVDQALVKHRRLKCWLHSVETDFVFCQ